jgi:hypothetical protein
MSYPLKVMLHSPTATGNIAKWAAELAEFELDFLPHHVVKSQVLADFVADWKPPPCHPEGPDNNELEVKAPVFTKPHWTLFFDGSSCKQGVESGILLLTPSGDHFKYMVHLDIKTTNDMVEYGALIFGLNTALSLGVQQLLVKGDS